MRRVVLTFVLLLGGQASALAAEYRTEAITVMGRLTYEASLGSKNVEDFYVRARLNQEPIFETQDFDVGSMKAVYPNWEAAELVLVGYGPRTHCAGFFRVFDFRGGKVQISEEFGNCKALVDPSNPQLRQYPGIAKNPVYVDGTWRIAIIGDKKNPKWFVYKEGHIAEEGNEAQKPGGEEYRYEQKLSVEVPDKAQRAKLIEQHGSAKAAYFYLLDQRAHEAVKKTFDMNR